MMQRLRIFLVVLLLTFTINFFGQNILQKNYKGQTIQQILTYKKSNTLFLNKSNFQFEPLSIINTYLTEEKREVFFLHPLATSCFKDLIIQNEGIVCRAEYKFQKATTIPLRLRLGSLDYTNYLEQKPNALKPN